MLQETYSKGDMGVSMKDEIWKPIKGYEGLYEVSNKGRVRSLGRVSKRNQGSKVVEYTKNPRILKQQAYGKKRNYLSVNLYQHKNIGEQRKLKTFYVHRLVAETFIPNPLGKCDVNHIDGNPHNNDVCNLEWATRKENIVHAYNNGLTKTFGSNHPLSKLTEEQVREIRSTYQEGVVGFGCNSLAQKYNVSKTLIQKIVKGKTWKRISIS